MLVADAPFVPQETLELRVILPYTEQTDRSVDIDAEVCWCGPDANDDYFDAGFRFLNASAQLREVISDVVEDVGFAA